MDLSRFDDVIFLVSVNSFENVSELFLDSKNLDYGPAYNSGQLRIAFAAGNRLFGDRLSGGAILGSSEKLRKHAIKSTELNTELWSDDFHTYVIEWKPSIITYNL